MFEPVKVPVKITEFLVKCAALMEAGQETCGSVYTCSHDGMYNLCANRGTSGGVHLLTTRNKIIV
jgi:hypothetical protein